MRDGRSWNEGKSVVVLVLMDPIYVGAEKNLTS